MDIAIERLESLRVADVMTRQVFCIPVDETLQQAAKRFLDKGVASAPVIDREGVCVGMVGLRELLRVALGATATDPEFGAGGGSDGNGTKSSMGGTEDGRRVAEVMSHGVQSIAPETGILAAARIMCLQHAHRLVVLDSQGAPIGMVSSMDVVSTLVNVMDEMQRK